MHKIWAVAVLLTLIAGVGCADRQNDTLAGDNRPGLAGDDRYESQMETQIAEGQLVRIDKDNDFIWVKTLSGDEMQFSYGMTTDVEGAGDEVEGLVDDVEALPQGTQVRVHYRPGVDEDILSDDDINSIVKIEVSRPL